MMVPPRAAAALLLCALCAAAATAAADDPLMMPGDQAPGPLCVPLLRPSPSPSPSPSSASASAPAGTTTTTTSTRHCLDPRRTGRPFLLYVYHPSDAFSRRAVAPDALDLFLKELRPLPQDAPFDFLFAVAPTREGDDDDSPGAAATARAQALLKRLDEAVGRLKGAALDVGPIVGSDGEEADPPARLRYGVIAPSAAAAAATTAATTRGSRSNSHHRAASQQRHPWGWAPSVLSAWPDPSAMRLIKVWADGDEQQQEAAAADASPPSFRAAAANPSSPPPLLVTATRLGSRFPWLLPGFLPHPDDDGPPNATLSYPLAAVGHGFVRRACSGAAAADDADANDNETLGDTRDAVVLIPFAYGSSPEADAGCTYWHVLRAAQQELGAAGALFHAPLPPSPSSSPSSSPSASSDAPLLPPPTAPGGLEEQLFQPSYVSWPGFDAPPFDEDADPGPQEGGAEIPAASVERPTAAAIRAALSSGLSGSSSSSSPVALRAGFVARPLPTGAAALAVDTRGRLQEAGWLKLPSLEHAAWAARYLSWRESVLDRRLDALSAAEAKGRALVVPVIGSESSSSSRPLSADKGRVSAAAELPPASQLARFGKVEVDFELDCPGGVDASCPQWDHVLQTFVCCSVLSSDGSSSSRFWRRPACSPSPAADCWGTKWRRANPALAGEADEDDDTNDAASNANACGRELLRVVTPFRRRGGRWLVDVTRLRGLLHPPSGAAAAASDSSAPITCAVHVQGPPWAGPWVPRLALRFSEPLDEGQAEGGGGGGDNTATTSSPSSPSIVHVKALWPTLPGSSFDVSESPPGGGNCDTSGAHPTVPLPAPPPSGQRLKRATLIAAVTGHGAAEFVPSTHSFYLEQGREEDQGEEGGGNGGDNNTPRPGHRRQRRLHLLTADMASYRPGGVWGSGARGCVTSVDVGSVPNEHGTWLYTRAGWCDGGPADPWAAADVTEAVREAWRVEEDQENGGGRARIAYGCVFPSGGWGQEEGLLSGARRRRQQGQASRRREAGGPGGGEAAAADEPSFGRSSSPARRRRLLDEPDAAFMMEATLVLEYEEEAGGGGGGGVVAAPAAAAVV